MLIHKKILGVMGDIKAITKSNQADGFQFRGVDDVYNSLQPLFRKHSIFCTTEVLSHKENGLGKTLIEAKFTFFTDDGSSVFSVTRGEVTDKTDKGTASALSVAHRTALVQMFLIPTQDSTPWLTAHLYAKSKERIAGGDYGLYWKLEAQYQMTKEQKTELQEIIIKNSHKMKVEGSGKTKTTELQQP